MVVVMVVAVVAVGVGVEFQGLPGIGNYRLGGL